MEASFDNPNPTVVTVNKERGGHTLKDRVYDLIRDIRDPEHPHTLEELSVVTPESVTVEQARDGYGYGRVTVSFVPTVPHCSLASVIGLSIVSKVVDAGLLANWKDDDKGNTSVSTDTTYYKLKVMCATDSHQHADDITKQLADKERVAAALENPRIATLLSSCVNNLAVDDGL